MGFYTLVFSYAFYTSTYKGCNRCYLPMADLGVFTATSARADTHNYSRTPRSNSHYLAAQIWRYC